MVWDGYKVPEKLPSPIYSSIELFFIKYKLAVGIFVYFLLFFVWPIAQTPEPLDGFIINNLWLYPDVCEQFKTYGLTCSVGGSR